MKRRYIPLLYGAVKVAVTIIILYAVFNYYSFLNEAKDINVNRVHVYSKIDVLVNNSVKEIVKNIDISKIIIRSSDKGTYILNTALLNSISFKAEEKIKSDLNNDDVKAEYRTMYESLSNKSLKLKIYLNVQIKTPGEYSSEVLLFESINVLD